MKPINVGLLGVGTVGGGTFEVLARNQEEITRRAGRGIVITKIADKDLARARKIAGNAATVTADAYEVVNDPSIDIVIELIGGTSIAQKLILKAIENRKHVITANKALLATHGNEIVAAARAHGVMVAFEAAVAGGIPIVKTLREGADRQPNRMDRRHHQRHQQFHPLRDAGERLELRQCPEGSAASGLRRS